MRGMYRCLLHGHLGLSERSVGGRLVTDLPVEDVVIHFTWLICAQHWCIGLQCLERINHDRERLVVNLNRIDAIRCRIAVCGQYRSHFLGLIHHLLDRQDHLRVGHQGRHPV